MKLTNFHAQYYANILTKTSSLNSVEKLAAVLSDAQVDLNPHQIEAALFAFKNPLAKGVILADEVGLGKTIEAGIVIAQKWAENKRKILIIVPANLHFQWKEELSDKFYLESVIIDGNYFSSSIKNVTANPFEQNCIVITSYNFVSAKTEYIDKIQWDMVVIDEAHRLRNVYKMDNVIATNIYNATKDSYKLLLTATPLQNSLLELYGIVSFVDDYVFGNLESFKQQFLYMKSADNSTLQDLTDRLKNVCIRTLRRQVTEYINYTERLPITQEFTPTADEQRLYDKVSNYLQKDNLWALPTAQRYLISLILWKQLASSTYAIAETLRKLANRLQYTLEHEGIVDIADLDEGITLKDYEYTSLSPKDKNLSAKDKAAIQREIDELTEYYNLAVSIKENAKGNALLTALENSFAKLRQLKAPQKVVIFTESRRTQEYLFSLLNETQYKDKVTLFHGNLNTAEKRQAVINQFRENYHIMIVTEAAAEGLNLQFCAMLINYDLPWNPQRIEQRIGRVHRYGQKYDVVVINFLNKNNVADQRVYELLCDKFQLFEGVFGASDSVLGNIDSLDFEKRIIEIYQKCRTEKEIENSFSELKESLKQSIDENMEHVRLKLLENFDEEVTEKLKLNATNSKNYLSRIDTLFWELTKYYLNRYAYFYDDEKGKGFRLEKNPFSAMRVYPPKQMYYFNKEAMLSQRYRINCPIAQNMFFDIKHNYRLPVGQVEFDLTNYKPKISVLEGLIGKRGYMGFYKTLVTSVGRDEYLSLVGFTSDGTPLTTEQLKRFWSLSGKARDYVSEMEYLKDELKSGAITRDGYEESLERLNISLPETARNMLQLLYEQEKERLINELSEQNATFFDEEIDKLDKWAKDVKLSMEKQLKDIDVTLGELKLAVRKAVKLQDKVELQKKIQELESKRNEHRYSLYSEQDKIDKQKEKLIEDMQDRLRQDIKDECVFVIEWKIL